MAHLENEQFTIVRDIVNMSEKCVASDELMKDPIVWERLGSDFKYVPNGDYSDLECDLWTIINHAVRLGMQIERRKRGEAVDLYAGGIYIPAASTEESDQ